MLKTNSITAGVLMGLLFPVISLIAVYFLKDNLYLLNKPALPYLVAIAANLIIMRICSKKDMVHTVKGIMITTFAFMLLVLFIVIHRVR
jgi:zinc transporter ZupT